MSVDRTALVLGAGVFGLEAAHSLAARGFSVTVVDKGPVPHPLAASTDLSKAVRMDYGDDDAYADAMLRCLERWRERNESFGTTLFHETGVTYLTRERMAEDSFEHQSLARLLARGVAAERLDAAAIHRRFPAWREGFHKDGYVNPVGGWVESGRLIEALASRAQRTHIQLRLGAEARALIERGGRVCGATLEDGAAIEADLTVLTLGAWSSFFLPELAAQVRPTGHPVFLLRPRAEDAALFEGERFATYGSDIAKTGWYGFPLHPREGLVKIAHHGAGRALHPEASDRVVTDGQIAALRAFVRDALPALADAPIERTRLCLYADTDDGHFLIDRVPSREGLVVATGDSGHALKFAPLVGGWIADVCEGKGHALSGRFCWRNERATRRGEAARHWGEHE